MLLAMKVEAWKTRKFLNIYLSYTFKMLVLLFNIKIEHEKEVLAKEGHLIICNHLSYLDIIILGSIYPSCFVTSIEMKNTVFLGQVCTLAGCLFVERRSKKNIGSEIKEITEGLNNGLNVIIFPEAKSSSGDHILRYRRPLFKSAQDSKSSILSLVLNYTNLNGGDISIENRDNLFWYGEMNFLRHFLNFLKQKEVNVTLKTCSLKYYSEELTTTDIATQAYTEASMHYVPISSEQSVELSAVDNA